MNGILKVLFIVILFTSHGAFGGIHFPKRSYIFEKENLSARLKTISISCNVMYKSPLKVYCFYYKQKPLKKK